MQNFVYHNPTKILFGRNTRDAIGPESRIWGQRGLLVYGQNSIKKNGLYEQTTTALQQADIEFAELGGTRSNPLLSHVRHGIELAKKHGAEVIIAVGGGSVIDTAKAIAVGALVDHDVWKFFTGKKGVKQSLPVSTVLTLAASGSEMNSGMVITNDTTREKFGFGHRLLFPKVSILDPEATFTVPPDYTVYGAVDAISHVLEFYLTTTDPDTPVQDRLMEGLIENAMTSCERCLHDPYDYNGRANLMWTATLALNGLTAAGLGRVGFPMHLIEHSLSALYNVPHGAGLAVVMLGWLRYHAETAAQRIGQLGQRIFPLKKSTEFDAEQTLIRLEEWLHQVQAPVSLQDLGIPDTEIPRIAENSKGLARLWRLRDYTPEVVAAILQRCR